MPRTYPLEHINSLIGEAIKTCINYFLNLCILSIIFNYKSTIVHKSTNLVTYFVQLYITAHNHCVE